MGQPLITSAERNQLEGQLLDNLLGMYAQQHDLYQEILDLSRRQRDLVREGAPLGQIRGLLQRKKQRLDTIRGLEARADDSKDRWRRGRPGWSPSSRARLHRTLAELGRVIEDILTCEEENDLELLQQCR